MDLTPYLRSLREDFVAAAAVGDEDTRRAAAALGSAIEPSARLAIMNALSDFAAEVTGALDHTTVDVRLDGRDVKVIVTDHPAGTGDPGENAAYPGPAPDGFPPPPPAGGSGWHGHHLDPRFEAKADHLRRMMQETGGDLSRTTVRLFNDLKAQAEQAASAQGVSLNTYISRAVSDSVRGAVPQGFVGPGKAARAHKGTKPGERTITGFIQA